MTGADSRSDADGSGQPTGSTERKARLYDEYEQCDICDGGIDLTSAGYFKSSNDETFRHALCHENGEPTEGYVAEITDTEKCCTNRQYNCGHKIYAPQTEQPTFCPECNDLEYDGEEWSVEPDTDQPGGGR